MHSCLQRSHFARRFPDLTEIAIIKNEEPFWFLVFNLRLSHLGAGLGRLLRRGDFDFAHAAFVTHDVLLQRTEQALGMLGREDDAALDTGLLHAGQHRGEIEDELRRRVGYDCQVGVMALRHLLVQLDVEPELLCFSHRLAMIMIANVIFSEARYAVRTPKFSITYQQIGCHAPVEAVSGRCAGASRKLRTAVGS